MKDQMTDELPDDGPSPIEFRPSLDAQVVPAEVAVIYDDDGVARPHGRLRAMSRS